MKKKPARVREMRAEYQIDYGMAERGRYYRRLLKPGSAVVIVAPDVAKAFPDAESVNRALRLVLKAAEAGQPRKGGRR